MHNEIERKFLVKNMNWMEGAQCKKYRQGYFPVAPNTISMRVRICEREAFLTIKSKQQGQGFTRKEFEYEIPVNDAEIILDTICLKPTIEKTRYLLRYDSNLWEIDVFHGENEGLVIAEIELESETQQIILPDWVGKEVTCDLKYYNSMLVRYPFAKWSKRDILQHNSTNDDN